MGDGGLGIGGAHLLAACRRNLDLTLLVLNNFNFGMTGGQFSCTTPEHASVASGFLNVLEKPMDVCSVAMSAGAPFVARSSVYRKDLPALIVEAISFAGFSIVDLWGGCPARYLKRNPMSPKEIEAAIQELPPFHGFITANARREYGSHYRERGGRKTAEPDWQGVAEVFEPAIRARRDMVLLGSAGERVITAGTLLAHAAISAGMHVTQKNDYNITVMRGPSVTELIISPDPITYTGVGRPDVIVALSPEGVEKRTDLFGKMNQNGLIILASAVEIPATKARVLRVDFKEHGIRRQERALAALSLLARERDPITPAMLENALQLTFKGKSLEEAVQVLEKAAALPLESQSA
jgi:2-oxoglutarate ferredoxin oxidoreductase subunit beta